MGDDLNKTYTWICPKCGQRYEEPDIGQLEVRTQTHRCKTGTESRDLDKEDHLITGVY